MLSRPEIHERLADGFTGVLFDYHQAAYYEGRFGVHLTTGDQLLLDPKGAPIRTGLSDGTGKPVVIYGRHGRDTTRALLSDVLSQYPPKRRRDDLRIEWFLAPETVPWPNPMSPELVASLRRVPLAIVDGPVPRPLENPAFLRWHVRQFVWKRGDRNRPGGIRVRSIPNTDGTNATDLGRVDGGLPAREMGRQLDALWLKYMRNRPLTARGYHENPSGLWMESVRSQMIGEDETVRRLALAGALLPPGRTAGERAPYSND